MIAIRLHGHGGQGVVVASKVLASALFREGWQVQAFPSFGVERRGTSVMAFVRCAHSPINEHYQVHEPDCVVVLDPLLLEREDVTSGLRHGGWVIVNSSHPPLDLDVGGLYGVATCDATAIALERGLGSPAMPLVNTAIAGAFAAATALVSLDAIVDTIPSYVPENVAANQQAARDAFGATLVRGAALAAARTR